jgi:hypothetical protein
MHYKPNSEQIDEIFEKRKQIKDMEQKKMEKKEKLDNYAKYVREMYWPKVSVKKQLELEHIRSNLRNQPLRKSMEDMPPENEDAANSRKHLNYDKPWRDRMSKKPRDKMERDESFLSL